MIALAKDIGFDGLDAGHLDASRNIENLGLPWDSLPTSRNGIGSSIRQAQGSIKQPLSRLGDTCFIVCANHPVCDELYFTRGVSHGYR